MRHLRSNGLKVRAFGRNPLALQRVQSYGSEVFAGDLRNADAVLHASSGCDLIFHVGAFSAPWGNREEFYSTNVVGTQNVITACRIVGAKRLVHVSSPSVTFDGGNVVHQDETSSYPKRFLCYYSETKKLAEDAVNAAQRQGLETTIIRPKAVIGPGDRSIVPKIIRSGRAGRLPQIGDGKNLVDLTFVENIAHGLYLSAISPSAVGKTYVLTNDHPVPIWDAIREIFSALKLNTNLKPIGFRFAWEMGRAMETLSILTRKEPILTRYTVGILGREQTYNIDRAKRDFGYTPLIDISSAISRTIDDARKQNNL